MVFTFLLSIFSGATALGFAVLLIVDLAAGAPQAAIAKGLALVVPTAAVALLLARKKSTLGQLRVFEAAVFAAVTLYLATGAYALGVADLQAGSGNWNATLLRFALLMVAYGVFVPNSVQRAATLLDFGLVQTEVPLDDSGQLTLEGTTSGTPAYMAPEMAVQLDAVDGRADIYMLGCVAYWLLTSKQVFEAETGVALIVEHVRTALTPPSQRMELEILPELESIVMKCLEKDPADRFQTPGELADALAAVPVSQPWTAKRAAEWWDLHIAEAHAA